LALPFPDMTFFKKILFTVFVVFIIAFFSLWLLMKSIKPETIKQYINSQLTSITHQPSQVKGPLDWQFFPRPRIKLQNIEIGNRTTNGPYTLSIDNLLLNLQIMSLLHGKIVFSDLHINGLKLYIDSLHKNATNHKPKETTKKKKKQKKISKHKSQFAIDRFLLTNGQITLKQGKNLVHFKDIQLELNQFAIGVKPFPVQLKTKLDAEINQHNIYSNIHYKGNLSFAYPLSKQNTYDNLTSKGHLSLNNININTVKIDSLNANLAKNHNILRLSPLTVSLYEGHSIGDLEFDLRKRLLSINQTATKLNANNLMKDLAGTPVFSGVMDYSIHTHIPTDNYGIENWTGKGTITVKDGALTGIDINQLIQEISDQIDHLVATKKFSLKNSLSLGELNLKQINEGSTQFKLASMRYQLINGSLITAPLVLQTEKLHIDGKGSLNLKTHKFNSSLGATIMGTNEISNIFKVQQILGGSFPLTISGTLEKPMIYPDLSKINIALTRLLLHDTLNKPVKDLKKQIKSILK